MEGSEEFQRTMSDFSPNEIYSRSKNCNLLINDINRSKNVIAAEKEKMENTNKNLENSMQLEKSFIKQA